MAPVNLKSLVSNLNDTCRRSLEGAAGLCLSRTNYNVEIIHWLLKLLEVPNTDLTLLLPQSGVDCARLQQDLCIAIDGLKTGNSRPPNLSVQLVDLLKEAWVLSSTEYGSSRIRSGHVLCALFGNDNVARLVVGTSAEFFKLNAETLRKHLRDLKAESCEGNSEPPSASATRVVSQLSDLVRQIEILLPSLKAILDQVENSSGKREGQASQSTTTTDGSFQLRDNWMELG